jgi:SAM-dependent methyltransferase
MHHHAAEFYSFEQVLALLPETALWVKQVMRRLSPLLPSRPLRVLEIGASQGRGLVALERLGHKAFGAEPWRPAAVIAHQIADAEGLRIKIAQGQAENLPFQDEQFQLVLAFSVMEHVTELELSLREIHRVLRPGGIFWFNSASALCPRQGEIASFPLFGWYPDPLKRRIMHWAMRSRPELVGHTKTPAVHWWTPRKARMKLRKAGFREVWDRWDLRLEDEESGFRRTFLVLAKANRALRLLGDVVTPDCAYAAQKPG